MRRETRDLLVRLAPILDQAYISGQKTILIIEICRSKLVHLTIPEISKKTSTNKA